MSREEINIDNSDFSSEYLRTNLRFNMEQVKEIDTLLRKASKGLFLPVKRIFEFYSQNLSLFKKRFKALRQDAEKVNSIQNETTQEKETGSQSLNSTVSGLSNEESEILKNLCASTMNVVGLLNNLFNTSQFDELVKSLPQEIKNLKKEVLSDDENCFKDDEALEKSKKKKFLGKKKKRANSENEKNEKSNENGRTPNKAKSKKKPLSEESEQKEKRYSDEEATEVMKEKFNENFKGITKTFLTRKLTKNITWSSEFDFNIEDPLQNQKETETNKINKISNLTFAEKNEIKEADNENEKFDAPFSPITHKIMISKNKPQLLRKPTEYVQIKKKENKKKRKYYKLKCMKEFDLMNRDKHPNLGVSLSKITTIRLICLILLILFVLPYLNNSSYMGADLTNYDFALILLENWLIFNQSLFLQKLDLMFLNETYLNLSGMDLISIGFSSRKLMCKFAYLCEIYPNSTIFLDYAKFNATRTKDLVFINQTFLYMVYNIQEENKLDAILQIFKIIFVTLILFSGAFVFLRDSNDVVVLPLEETYKGISQIKFNHENFFHDHNFKLGEMRKEEKNNIRTYSKLSAIREENENWKNRISNTEHNADSTYYPKMLKRYTSKISMKLTDKNNVESENDNDVPELPSVEKIKNNQSLPDKAKLDWLVKNDEFMMIQRFYIKLQKLIISIYGFRVFDYFQSTVMTNPKAKPEDDHDGGEWASTTVDPQEVQHKVENNPFFNLNGMILIVEVSNWKDVIKEHQENTTKVLSRLVEICDLSSFETFGEVIKIENERIFIFWDQGKSYKVQNMNNENSKNSENEDKDSNRENSSESSLEYSPSNHRNSGRIFTESLLNSHKKSDEYNELEFRKAFTNAKKDENFKIQVLPELRSKSALHHDAANLALITAIKIYSRVYNDDVLNPHLVLNKSSLLQEPTVDLKMGIHKGKIYNFITNSSNRMESVYTGNSIKECILLNKLNNFKLQILFTNEVFTELHRNLRKFSRDITLVIKNSKNIENNLKTLVTKKVFSYDLDFNKPHGKNPYLSELKIDSEHGLVIRKSLIEQVNLGLFDIEKVISYDSEISYARVTDTAFLEFFNEGMDYYQLANFYQASTFLNKALIFKSNDILTKYLLNEINKKK